MAHGIINIRRLQTFVTNLKEIYLSSGLRLGKFDVNVGVPVLGVEYALPVKNTTPSRASLRSFCHKQHGTSIKIRGQTSQRCERSLSSSAVSHNVDLQRKAQECFSHFCVRTTLFFSVIWLYTEHQVWNRLVLRWCVYLDASSKPDHNRQWPGYANGIIGSGMFVFANLIIALNNLVF